MNILHLYSDARWTGPVEPVLSLCQELSHRGHHLVFAYRRPPQLPKRSIAGFVGNFKVVSTDQFRLNRYFSFRDNWRDFMGLRRFVRENNISVVHTHLDHDHAVAAIALLGRLKKRSGTRAQPAQSSGPVLVRSDHKRDSIAPSLTNRLLIRRAHGVVTFSERAQAHFIRQFGLSPAGICLVNPATDTEKFSPEKGARSLREAWGLNDGDIAVGMVARFQKYRKSGMLLRALQQALTRAPRLKVILIGRSSQMEEAVHKPVRELGLERQVVVAGYLTDRYIDGLASLDGFVFPIAGSDGTGRALREAMAMGKAVIVNNVGMLPEMIEDGRSGLLFHDTAESLAEQLVRIGQDAPLRERLGEGARDRARQRFSLSDQATAVEAFYRQLIGSASV